MTRYMSPSSSAAHLSALFCIGIVMDLMLLQFLPQIPILVANLLSTIKDSFDDMFVSDMSKQQLRKQ
eukprot:5746128-Amphidinium_carterae.1